MDQLDSPAFALREARLAEVEAIEVALTLACEMLTRLEPRDATRALVHRAMKARDEAAQLHWLLRGGGQR